MDHWRNLLLEMISAAAVIAKYWGIYLSTVFATAGLDIPSTVQLGGLTMYWGPFLVVAVFTVLLMVGTQVSAQVNNVFTLIKIAITLFVIVVGFTYMNTDNFSPFIPPSQPPVVGHGVTGDVWGQPMLAWLFGAAPSQYGWLGVISGASLVFFAFLGFDIVATSAEEVKDPQRTLPRGILGGLALVTVLYILVTLALTGMVPYTELAKAENPSLATAFVAVGADWAAQIIAMGVLGGMTTVGMVLLMGSSRVLLAPAMTKPRSFAACGAGSKALKNGLQRLKHLTRRVYRARNVFLGVGAAHKAGLVQRRGKVVAALQHAVVELVEQRAVGLHYRVVSAGQLGQQVKTEQAALPVDAKGNVGRIGFGFEPLHQVAGLEVQVRVEARLADQLQRLEAAGRGNRVARQRASLVDRAQGREFFHDGASAAERGHGHAAANDLAQHGQVGRKALDLLGVNALRAAQSDAKARHHLVVDHQRAVLLRQLTDAAVIQRKRAQSSCCRRSAPGSRRQLRCRFWRKLLPVGRHRCTPARWCL